MRILLTTHGLPHDKVALRFGAYIALNSEEATTVLTVIENESDRARGDGILRDARTLLKEVPDVRTKIRIGHAASEIIREAEEGVFHVAVVGERQNPNLLARFLTGSTSVRVVEHAPCPVIVAKGNAGPIRRILLCDSGAWGPLSFPAAGTQEQQVVPSLLTRFTAQLADMLHGEEEITVLHVMSQISAGPGVQGTELQADVQELIEEHTPEGELLKQDIQVLERPGVRVRPKVRHGLVVDEILAEAVSGDHDLVVIGAHRGAGWQRILLDDLAHKILIQLDRPVLVVR